MSEAAREQSYSFSCVTTLFIKRVDAPHCTVISGVGLEYSPVLITNTRVLLIFHRSMTSISLPEHEDS